MRIVNLKTFRELPVGTIFQKYNPYCFDELSVKNKSLPHDFFYEPITGCVDCNSSDDFVMQLTKAENGESIKMDFNIGQRDGCFEDDQLFAIYEMEDVFKLKDKINQCLQDMVE